MIILCHDCKVNNELKFEPCDKHKDEGLYWEVYEQVDLDDNIPGYISSKEWLQYYDWRKQ